MELHRYSQCKLIPNDGIRNFKTKPISEVISEYYTMLLTALIYLYFHHNHTKHTLR